MNALPEPKPVDLKRYRLADQEYTATREVVVKNELERILPTVNQWADTADVVVGNSPKMTTPLGEIRQALRNAYDEGIHKGQQDKP